MFPLSAAGVVVQGQSHQRAVQVQVLHGGRVVAELAGSVLSGSVDSDADQPIMRSLALQVVDASGDLSKTDVGELLSPYDAEVKPSMGVVLPSGRFDMVPLGVFRLTSTDVKDGPDGLVVSLTGQDRALTYQMPLPGPVTIPAGTTVERAVQLLLRRVNAGLLYTTWVTGRTVGPLLYEADSEAWDSALTLAESVGGWLFHDRNGRCVLAPYAGSLSPTVQRFDKTLLSVSRSEDADSIRNSVVVQSSESGVGKITATAEDTDPRSPTYVGGAYGRRQVTVTNPHVGTPAMAVEAAQAQLIRELGRSQQVTWTCVPDVQTDPGDSCVVHRPRAGLLERRLIVAGTSLPLGVEGEMTITARRSIVLQGGGFA